MTPNSEALIGVSKSMTTFEDLINEERIMQLKRLLEQYDEIATFYIEGEDENGEDLYPKDFILKTFKFKRPVTCIEIFNKNSEEVLQFRKQLEKFFFVRHKADQIFISRFRTLCDSAIGKKRRGLRKIKVCHHFPDFEGLYYGYPLKEIAQYCLKEEKYHLIK